MTTQLATIDRSGYLALAGGEDMSEIVEANLGEDGGLDVSLLTRVKVPSGGGTNWSIPNVATGEDDAAKLIEGAFLYWSKQGLLWPNEEPVEGDMPVLVTHDLRTAELVGPIPAELNDLIEDFRLGEKTYDWSLLAADNGPFGFGTGKSGYGKRVKEQRLLFLLRKDDLLPTVVTVPPGSLRNFSRFMAGMTGLRMPYWKTAVRLGLEPATSKGGQKYARIVFGVAGRLDDETATALRTAYGAKLEAAARELAEQAEQADAMNGDE